MENAKYLTTQLERIYKAIADHQDCISKGESRFYHTNSIETLSKMAAKKESELKQITGFVLNEEISACEEVQLVHHIYILLSTHPNTAKTMGNNTETYRLRIGPDCCIEVKREICAEPYEVEDYQYPECIMPDGWTYTFYGDGGSDGDIETSEHEAIELLGVFEL